MLKAGVSDQPGPSASRRVFVATPAVTASVLRALPRQRRGDSLRSGSGDAGSCVASANSRVQLRALSSIGLMAPFQTFTTRLVRSSFSVPPEPSTWNSRCLRSRASVSSPDSGSRFKTNKPDGEEITRAYSIASPPGEDESLRALPQPGAGWLHVEFPVRHERGRRDHLPGALRRTSSCGRPCAIQFSSPPAPASRLFARCCIGCLAESGRHQDKEFWLVFGNRTESDIYYHEEFLTISPPLIPTFTTCQPSAVALRDWQGLRGYVQEHVPGIVGQVALTCTLTSAVWTR